MKPVVFLILLLCVELVELRQRRPRDNTRVSEKKGEDFVTTVVRMIRNSNIFPEDNQFLRRIAWVESMDGTHPNTFRQGYHGGIWQVNETGFNATKDTKSHPSLEQKHNQILSTFRINWTSSIIKWEDLRKPLHSGLAARLFLSIKPDAIPNGIENQARYWKQHYNTPQGTGTVQGFIDKARQLATKQSELCTIKTDLMFVMDASGSVGSDNFDLMKDFVKSFANGLDIGRDKNQIGVIVFSNSADIVITLDSNNTKASLLTAIDAVSYTGGGTNTAEALRLLIDSFSEANGARPSALRIAIVMTDGQSSSDTVQEAQNLHKVVPSILTYAIGIGDNVNQDELEEIASRPGLIVQLASFNPNEFEAVQEQRTQEICFEVPTPVNSSGIREGNLAQEASQRLQFSVPEEGLTVRLCVTMGRVIFYAARSMTPNEAFYDWKIVSEAGCNTVRLTPNDICPVNSRRKRQANSAETLFVTIQGDGVGTNSFELESTTATPGQSVQIEPSTRENVTEGESITFSCLGSDPSSIVVERRVESDTSTSLTSFGSRIRINGTSSGRVHYILGPLLAEDHNAFLYCSSGVFISTEVLLNVLFSPRYLMPLSPLIVADGGGSTFTFELQGNPLTTEYQWYKDGVLLSPSFRVKIQPDSLTFSPVYLGDTGSYVAVASNYLGNGTLSFQLIVNYAPVFTERFGTFSCQDTGDVIECLAPAGSSGYLKCIAFGRPQPVISLETRTGLTNNVHFDHESGDVVIHSVSNDNRGFYTCVVRNSLAEVRRTFLLLVGDGYLPPVEDLQVAVHRNQDDLYLAVEWRYNTTSLSFPPSNFHVSVFSRGTGRAQPLYTWMLSRDTLSFSRSLATLSLRPQITYRVEVYSQNALRSSKVANSTFNFPRCPPVCSSQFCTNRRTRTALCTIPSTMRMSNCSVLCPVTFCHACYFGGEPRDVSSLSCTSCSGYERDELTRETKCFKRWAQCIRRADFDRHGKLPKAQRVIANFRCYEHPCV